MSDGTGTMSYMKQSISKAILARKDSKCKKWKVEKYKPEC